MFFKKKKSAQHKCESCGSKTESNHSFCPFCGNSFLDIKDEERAFGMLGRNDNVRDIPLNSMNSMGPMDKLINSVFNSLVKNLDKQMQNQFKDIEKEFSNSNAEIKSFPNGVRIKISGPFEQKQTVMKKQKPAARREIAEEQIQKMSTLPKAKAKTSVKRLGDKLVYELVTPGVSSSDDVFVSRVESGYEIKAIGNKKVYVNSIPINLPITKYSILKNKLLVEFNTELEE